VLKLDDYRLGGLYTVESLSELLPPRPRLRPRPEALELAAAGEPAGAHSGDLSAALSDVGADAERILEEAQRRAEELVDQAKHRAAEISEQAAAQGRAKAEELRAGMLLEAERAIEAELERRRAALQNEAADIIAQAQAQRQLILSATQREVITLAMAVARKIVAQELRVSADVVLATAADALAHLPADIAVAELAVNPADLELVRSQQAGLMQAAGHLTGLEIRPDPAIGRGGSLVRSEAGDVDSRISTRLHQIETALNPGGDAAGEGRS